MRSNIQKSQSPQQAIANIDFIIKQIYFINRQVSNHMLLIQRQISRYQHVVEQLKKQKIQQEKRRKEQQEQQYKRKTNIQARNSQNIQKNVQNQKQIEINPNDSNLIQKKLNQMYPDRKKLKQQLLKNFGFQLTQFNKLITDYLKKMLRNLSDSKVIIGPLLLRKIKNKLQQQDFLRFQNNNYGLKFIFYDLSKEAIMNIQLYKKREGGRISTLALKKLELLFIQQMRQQLAEENAILDMYYLNIKGQYYLKQVNQFMKGVCCSICGYHLMAFLPPTLRQVKIYAQQYKQLLSRIIKQVKTLPIVPYFHESCIF